VRPDVLVHPKRGHPGQPGPDRRPAAARGRAPPASRCASRRRAGERRWPLSPGTGPPGWLIAQDRARSVSTARGAGPPGSRSRPRSAAGRPAPDSATTVQTTPARPAGRQPAGPRPVPAGWRAVVPPHRTAGTRPPWSWSPPVAPPRRPPTADSTTNSFRPSRTALG
jgi:hypothetical protein